MNTIYNIDPPRLSMKQIENISEDILKDFEPSIFEDGQPTPIPIFIEKYLDIDLDFKCLSTDMSVLGVISFSDGIVEVYDESRRETYPLYVERGTILIENDLLSPYNTGRGRFTMAHEAGHWVLHKEICETMFRCEDAPRKLLTNNDWLEWQADTFASSILMPRITFKEKFYQLKKEVEDIGIDDEFLEFVAEQLANIFQVSYKAAFVRLQKLNLLQ